MAGNPAMRGMLGGMLRLIDALCTVGAWCAAIGAAALAAILVVEVISTSLFNWSQPWAVEYVIYLQAVVMFGGAGWALRNGGHIRVQMLFQALPQIAQRAAEAMVTAFALGIMGFLAWVMVAQAVRTHDLNSLSYYPMQTPVWIPQAALAVAFVLLALALFARLLRVLLKEPVEIENTVGGTIE